jgi:type I restriction enzyme S subunit
MVEGWINTTLDQLCFKITDGTHKTPIYQNEGIVFLSAKNVKAGLLDLSEHKFISKEEHIQLTKRCKPESGDVMLSKSGSLGDAIVIPNLPFEFSIFESLALLKTKRNHIDSEFLKQYLNSPISQEYFRLITSGVAVKHLHLVDLRKILIMVPPLIEQKKIAKILRTWDDAIEKVDILINNKKQEKAIFQAKIFDGAIISKRHEGINVSLYDLADWHNGIAFKSTDFSETGKPILKIAELKAGIISTTTFSNGKYSGNVLVKYGDLLFSWSGNPHTSIDAFIWCGTEGWLNQHIFRVIPKPNVHQFYLYQFLKYIKNRLAYIATGKQSTGLGHITKADMKRTYIVLPNMVDQIRISNVLSHFDTLISSLENKKRIFQSQKRGLMQKLLTGKWRVKINKMEIT